MEIKKSCLWRIFQTSICYNSSDKVFSFIPSPSELTRQFNSSQFFSRWTNSKSMIICIPWTHLQCIPLLPLKKMSGVSFLILLLMRFFWNEYNIAVTDDGLYKIYSFFPLLIVIGIFLCNLCD